MTPREFGTMTASAFALAAIFWFGVFAVTSWPVFMVIGILCFIMAILGLAIMAKECPNQTE